MSTIHLSDLTIVDLPTCWSGHATTRLPLRRQLLPILCTFLQSWPIWRSIFHPMFWETFPKMVWRKKFQQYVWQLRLWRNAGVPCCAQPLRLFFQMKNHARDVATGSYRTVWICLLTTWCGFYPVDWPASQINLDSEFSIRARIPSAWLRVDSLLRPDAYGGIWCILDGGCSLDKKLSAILANVSLPSENLCGADNSW